MKVAIWPQFSSNHSATFTVVGTFESEAKARSAAAEVESILRKIEGWWNEASPEEMASWGRKTETPALTPAEAEFRDQYQVEWPFSINWYHYMYRYQKPVATFKNLVIVQNPHPYITRGPQPFDTLLKSFGGAVATFASESQSFPDTILLADLKCVAPDETMAQLIAESVNEYIQKPEERPNPWLAYHSGSLDSLAQRLRQIESQAKQGQPINWQENEWVLDAVSEARLELDFVEDFPEVKVGVQRDGVRLWFMNLPFENWVSGLQALYAWLSHDGCTEMNYTFSQIRDRCSRSE